MTLNKDYMGALASFLCLMHCLAGPVLLTLGVSVVGSSIIENERIHLLLVIPIVLIAAWSLPASFKKHRQPIPVMIALTGIGLLLMGLMIEAYELPLTVAASMLLMSAHLYNRKLLSA